MDETGKGLEYFAEPDMMQYEDRLQSFKNWSKQLIPDKYAMAKAGFIYTGESDVVRCFGCSIRLSQWEKTDDPWVEHLKWSPECSFLKMVGCGAEVQALQPTERKCEEPTEVTVPPYHRGFNFRTGSDPTPKPKPKDDTIFKGFKPYESKFKGMPPVEVAPNPSPYHTGFNFRTGPFPTPKPKDDTTFKGFNVGLPPPWTQTEDIGGGYTLGGGFRMSTPLRQSNLF
jgi:hypothetical protein